MQSHLSQGGRLDAFAGLYENPLIRPKEWFDSLNFARSERLSPRRIPIDTFRSALKFLILLVLGMQAPSVRAMSVDGFFSRTKTFPAGPRLTPVRESTVPAACTRLRLEKIIRFESFSEVQKFFLSCERHYPKEGFLGLARDAIFGDLALERPERYHQVEFSVSEGETLRGKLALKDSSRPLPLVIFRGGLYYQGDYSYVASRMLLHYFEHAPFHVLVLENPTNEKYLQRNGSLRVGGFASGHQIHQVLRQLQASPYTRRFLEYHLVGASLGAHDAIFAAQMIERDPETKINSLTLLCPAVELESSLNNLFHSGLIGRANAGYVKGVIRRVRRKVRVIGEIFPDVIRDISVEGLGELFLRAAARQLQEDDNDSEAISAFQEHNRTLPVIATLETPAYFVQARNDSITPYRSNMGSLQSIARKRPNLHFLTTERGEHCGFSDVFGKDIMGTLLSGIIYRHSRFERDDLIIDASRELNERTFLGTARINPKPGSVVSGYELVKIRGKEAKLNIRYFEPAKRTMRAKGYQDYCHTYSYWNAPVECQTRYQLDLPASWIGRLSDAREIPEHRQQEINSIITRFNALGAVLGPDGREIIGRQVEPTFLRLPRWILESDF